MIPPGRPAPSRGPCLRGIPTRRLWLLLLVASILLMAGCGYNALMRADEQAKARWSELANQYGRRSDMVPAIVDAVRGDAAVERPAVAALVDAQARVQASGATPALPNDPAAFRRFDAAQRDLERSLARVLAAAGDDAVVHDLRAQLAGVDERITSARRRYAEAVRAYNEEVRRYPSRLTAIALGYAEKPAPDAEAPAGGAAR